MSNKTSKNAHSLLAQPSLTSNLITQFPVMIWSGDVYIRYQIGYFLRNKLIVSVDSLHNNDDFVSCKNNNLPTSAATNIITAPGPTPAGTLPTTAPPPAPPTNNPLLYHPLRVTANYLLTTYEHLSHPTSSSFSTEYDTTPHGISSSSLLSSSPSYSPLIEHLDNVCNTPVQYLQEAYHPDTIGSMKPQHTLLQHKYTHFSDTAFSLYVNDSENPKRILFYKKLHKHLEKNKKKNSSNANSAFANVDYYNFENDVLIKSDEDDVKLYPHASITMTSSKLHKRTLSTSHSFSEYLASASQNDENDIQVTVSPISTHQKLQHRRFVKKSSNGISFPEGGKFIDGLSDVENDDEIEESISITTTIIQNVTNIYDSNEILPTDPQDCNTPMYIQSSSHIDENDDCPSLSKQNSPTPTALTNHTPSQHTQNNVSISRGNSSHTIISNAHRQPISVINRTNRHNTVNPLLSNANNSNNGRYFYRTTLSPTTYHILTPLSTSITSSLFTMPRFQRGLRASFLSFIVGMANHPVFTKSYLHTLLFDATNVQHCELLLELLNNVYPHLLMTIINNNKINLLQQLQQQGKEQLTKVCGVSNTGSSGDGNIPVSTQNQQPSKQSNSSNKPSQPPPTDFLAMGGNIIIFIYNAHCLDNQSYTLHAESDCDDITKQQHILDSVNDDSDGNDIDISYSSQGLENLKNKKKNKKKTQTTYFQNLLDTALQKLLDQFNLNINLYYLPPNDQPEAQLLFFNHTLQKHMIEIALFYWYVKSMYPLGHDYKTIDRVYANGGGDTLLEDSINLSNQSNENRNTSHDQQNGNHNSYNTAINNTAEKSDCSLM